MQYLYLFLCITIAFVPAFLVYKKVGAKEHSSLHKWTTSALRFTVFFLTAMLLLAPAFQIEKEEEENPVILWLHDNSSSMHKSLAKDSTIFRQKFDNLSKYFEKDYEFKAQGYGKTLQNKDSLFIYEQEATDINMALEESYHMYKDRNVGAFILSGDGIFNQGKHPIYLKLGKAIPIYTLVVGDSTTPKDIAITKVYANKSVTYQSEFEVLIDIRAEKLGGEQVELNILQGKKNIHKEKINIIGEQYTTSARLMLRADKKGFQKYTAIISALEGEQNVQNNHYNFIVEVLDQEIKILLIAPAAHPDISTIKNALNSMPQYKIEEKNLQNLPQDFDKYDLLIAHQFPFNLGDNRQLPASKPLWSILGKLTDISNFNLNQSLVDIQPSVGFNHATPLLNTDFSLFQLPENMQEFVAQMPPLIVPNGQYQLGTDAGQILFKQKIGNVRTDYPMWIYNQSLVPQVITLGESIWRWRMYEYKHYKHTQSVDELIRQTVNFLAAKKDDNPFKVFPEKQLFSDNEPINIYAELRNNNGELINTPDAQITIMPTEADKEQPLNLSFEKQGNSYRINVGLLEAGEYTYEARTKLADRVYQIEGFFSVNEVSVEDLRWHSDYKVMSDIAQNNQGEIYTIDNMDEIYTAIRENETIKPLIHTYKDSFYFIDKHWIFFIILFTISIEWLLRKYWNL